MFPPVGNSGMGSYHGKFSFDNLSHLRGCLIKQLKMEGVNDMRYPPHTAKKLFWARFFILKNPDLGWLGRMTLLAIFAVVAAVVLQVRRREESVWWGGGGGLVRRDLGILDGVSLIGGCVCFFRDIFSEIKQVYPYFWPDVTLVTRWTLEQSWV